MSSNAHAQIPCAYSCSVQLVMADQSSSDGQVEKALTAIQYLSSLNLQQSDFSIGILILESYSDVSAWSA